MRYRCFSARGAVVVSALSAGAVVMTVPNPADGAIFGPGLIATTGADGGDRLNVAEAEGQALAAGTYDVTNFSYNSTGVGDVTPFLAVSTAADTYDVVWVGTRTSGAAGTTVAVNPVGNFRLASGSTVYGGFYTSTSGTAGSVPGGRVAFNDNQVASTDHDSSFTIPRGGTAIAGFSNPNLTRKYAFSVAADPLAQTVVGPGFLATEGADGGPRLNVDNNRPVTVAAGTYDVADFSFNGTAAGGTVTPFLARLTGTDTYQTVWVGGGAAGAAQGVSVDPAGGFTLGATETLYAGFYTAGTAAVAFTEGPGRPPGFGVTDHDSAFTGPTAAGEAISGFSNANLERTYAFTIGFTPVPEPTALAAAALLAMPLLTRRRRGR